MVRVVVESGHSVTFDGVSFVGPFEVDVDSFDISTGTVTTGVCLVGAGGSVQVSPIHPEFSVLGLWVSLFFVLGINLASKVFR
jgi:hypothetical protein